MRGSFCNRHQNLLPIGVTGAHSVEVADLQQVLVLLSAELDVVVEDAATLVYSEIPAFRRIRLDEVRLGLAAIGLAGVAAVRDSRAITADELGAMAELGTRLAERGIPLEAMVRAFRLLARVALDKAVAHGAQLGVGLEELYGGMRQLWDWVDDAMVASAAGHRQHELARDRLDREARVNLMTLLLAGSIARPDLDAAAERLGLDPERSYQVVQVLPADQASRTRVEHALRATGTEGTHALIETLGDTLVAVLAQTPQLGTVDIAGVGRAYPLSAVHQSFVEASRALQVATAFGLTGAVCLSDVPVQAAILADDDLSTMVVNRCFAAIPETRGQREILRETLAALLDHDMRFDAAAAAMHVHTNTLRYRVQRFEQISGMSLDRTEDLVAVWWAVQRLRMIGTPT